MTTRHAFNNMTPPGLTTTCLYILLNITKRSLCAISHAAGVYPAVYANINGDADAEGDDGADINAAILPALPNACVNFDEYVASDVEPSTAKFYPRSPLRQPCFHTRRTLTSQKTCRV